MKVLLGIAGGIGVIALVVALVALGAAFWTWVIMLAMGAVAHSTENLGIAWGFWQVFPIGLVVALIVGAVTKND